MTVVGPVIASQEACELFYLRHQALFGGYVDGEPAILLLDKAYQGWSEEAHRELYHYTKLGWFSREDWQSLYHPYLKQLAAFLDKLFDQGVNPQSVEVFPGSTALPTFLRGANPFYTVIRLAQNQGIDPYEAGFLKAKQIHRWFNLHPRIGAAILSLAAFEATTIPQLNGMSWGDSLLFTRDYLI